jgi:hypothetical protein
MVPIQLRDTPVCVCASSPQRVNCARLCETLNQQHILAANFVIFSALAGLQTHKLNMGNEDGGK